MLKALAFVLERDVIHGVKKAEAKEFVEEKENRRGRGEKEGRGEKKG